MIKKSCAIVDLLGRISVGFVKNKKKIEKCSKVFRYQRSSFSTFTINNTPYGSSNWMCIYQIKTKILFSYFTLTFITLYNITCYYNKILQYIPYIM
jgi:hypothetical protein